jgi:uncharacterized protein (TIGR02246 family)
MKWLLGAAPIAVTALMLPASAQQTGPSARQVVEQIAATYATDWDQQDAAGIGELFIKDGVLISPSAAGAVTAGPQAIAQNYANFFKKGADHITVTLDQVASIADNVIIAYGGEFEVTGHGQTGPMKIDGGWTGVYVRDAGTWKIRILTAFPKPPPPAAK